MKHMPVQRFSVVLSLLFLYTSSSCSGRVQPVLVVVLITSAFRNICFPHILISGPPAYKGNLDADFQREL